MMKIYYVNIICGCNVPVRQYNAYLQVTTVFIDMGLRKTKHPWKRFQNFRQSRVLLTDRIEIHQSQPDSMTERLEGHTSGCNWWIWIRSVNNTQDWRKFWKRFHGCFVFQSRVSTKMMVNGWILCHFICILRKFECGGDPLQMHWGLAKLQMETTLQVGQWIREPALIRTTFLHKAWRVKFSHKIADSNFYYRYFRGIESKDCRE